MAIPERFKATLIVLASMAALALMPLTQVLAQEIYKTVDENGNVVYTDQKPSDDATPVTLKELTVVDPVELGDPEVLSETAGEVESAEDEALYDPGLTILSPASEQTINNTAYELDVQVGSERELPDGTELVYLVDGQARTRTRALNVSIDEVYRGEHQVSVELRTSGDGRTIARAGPVTFFMRQHSIQHPNPG